MNPSEIERAERAEVIQSVKALLIPFSLFLACVIMAAGVFLIYNNEPIGWAFAFVSVLTVLAAMIAFIRFQNKYRARGVMPPQIAEEGIIENPPVIHLEDDVNILDPKGTAQLEHPSRV